MCKTDNKYVNSFLSYLKTIKGKSTNTIEGYDIDLNLFIEFMKDYKQWNYIGKEQFKTIQLEDLYSFMGYLESERNNSANTRSRKTYCLKSFFKYLELTNVVSKNPTNMLERPKVGKRTTTYLTVEEMKKLLKTIEEYDMEKDYKRDKCLITLLLNTGLRLSEITDIKLSDINGDTLIVIGKGDKEAEIFLNDSCVKAINEWKEIRETKNIKSKEDEKYLFISRVGRHINKKSIENVVKKYITLAGLSENVTTHKLRHSFATMIYEQTGDIRMVQTLLRHSDISTTMIYTHVNNSDIKNVVSNNLLNK
ncbi:tyrosine recombinase XerC [Clostridium butyricum]|uniref:tyrosine recombinase XerC n=1 Tax=Clostridium butyricum TaxID=1492 RepID=UPI00325B88C6